MKPIIVKVGKGFEYDSVQEVLFNHGNHNIIIELAGGIQKENIVLNNAENIQIIGLPSSFLIPEKNKPIISLISSKNIKLEFLRIGFIGNNNQNLDIEWPGVTDAIRIERCEYVTVNNSLIAHARIAISINGSHEVALTGNLISGNSMGIHISNAASTGSIENNTLVRNKEMGLQYDTLGSFLIKMNIIAHNGYGVRFSSFVPLDSLDRNLSFNNEQGNVSQTTLQKYFLEKKLLFYDIEQNDFRLRDTKYLDYGANEKRLTEFFKFFNPLVPSKKYEVDFVDKRVTVFLNLSIPGLIDKFREFLTKNFNDWKLKNFTFVNALDQVTNDNTDLALIINAKDENKSRNLPNDILKKLQKLGKKYYVFFQSENFVNANNEINFYQIESIENTQKELEAKYKRSIIYYSSLDELATLTYDKLKSDVVKVVVKQLELINIGHFNKIVVNLDEKVTCLIGLNGTGKTTILRALALAFIGTKHKSIDLESGIVNLLAIKGLKEKEIIRESGKIILKFRMGSEEFEHDITFEVSSVGIVKTKSRSKEILNGEYLKTLILGFAQSRSEKNIKLDEEQRQIGRIQPPNIFDLTPLIRNHDDQRLKKFAVWISELDALANKIEKSSANKIVKERRILKEVFNIFSEITLEKVDFMEVTEPSTNEVWITTAAAPNGIPIDLSSQGFQSIMGWIGYFVERMAEAYPNSSDFLNEPAIAIIDEIDTYLHPRWQAKILDVLLRKFGNTQFIITT